MENLFRTILQLSFYGSVAIVIVMLFRQAMRKLPKQISCILWIIAGLRLICPLSFSSPISVLNLNVFQKYNQDALTFTQTAVEHNTQALATGGQAIVHNTSPATLPAVQEMTTAAPGINAMTILAIVWLAVTILLFAYTILKTAHTAHKLRDAEKLSLHVYISDQITSPFVLGIFAPKIYMPLGLAKQEWDYLYLHERTHLDKFDHITKLFAISILYIHWFNPLVWLAFNMLCNDIEMRCDEEVLSSMGPNAKKEYSLMLVNYASKVEPSSYRVVPVGFAKKSLGGIEIKTRVKNIIRYKKTPKVIVSFIFVLSMVSTLLLTANTNASTIQKQDMAENTVTKQNETETTTEVAKNKSSNVKSLYTDAYVNSNTEEYDESEAVDESNEYTDLDSANYWDIPRYGDYFNELLGEGYTLTSSDANEILLNATTLDTAYRFDGEDGSATVAVITIHNFETVGNLKSYLSSNFNIREYFDEYGDSDNLTADLYHIYANGPASDYMINYYPEDMLLIVETSSANLN